MVQWSTACLDWQERIVARPQRSLIPFDPLFPGQAEAALDIFRSLRIVDAAGRPTFGEVARPWIMDFVAAIFGAYDEETGRRLIQYFFMLISKKNGKSTLAAGIMVTALIRNWRDSGEYYILAPTKETADNSYKPARDMIMADPDLCSILKPSAGRVIEHRNTGAFLKVVAADSETVSGKKTIGLLIDELHLFGKRANASSMILEATGGLASRPEGFVIYLSTQSDSIPAGVFAQKLQEFRDIRDGKVVDPGSLPIIYEYPQAWHDAAAYLNPETWRITNPNLGASVNAGYLTDQLAKAQLAGRAQVNGFLAKHVNVEIGLGLRADRWAGAEYWERRTDPTLTKEVLLARSEVVIPGVDGGGLDDLMGLSLLGRDRETKEWLAWSHGWCHRGVLERRKSIAPLLLDFERAGELTIVDDDPLVDRLWEAMKVATERAKAAGRDEWFADDKALADEARANSEARLPAGHRRVGCNRQRRSRPRTPRRGRCRSRRIGAHRRRARRDPDYRGEQAPRRCAARLRADECDQDLRAAARRRDTLARALALHGLVRVQRQDRADRHGDPRDQAERRGRQDRPLGSDDQCGGQDVAKPEGGGGLRCHGDDRLSRWLTASALAFRRSSRMNHSGWATAPLAARLAGDWEAFRFFESPRRRWRFMANVRPHVVAARRRSLRQRQRDNAMAFPRR